MLHPHPLATCTFVLATLASSAACQTVTATVTAATAITATAQVYDVGVGGFVVNSNTIPAGTDLGPGATVSASATGDPFGTGSVTYTVTGNYGLTSTTPNIVYVVSFAGGGGNVTGASLLELTSATPVLGRLTCSLSVGLPNWTYDLDIGNDGSVEWNQSKGFNFEQHVVVSGTLPIRFGSNTNGGNPTWTITFTPLGPTDVVHDNGPIVTHPGQGPAGSDLSERQALPPFGMFIAGVDADQALGRGVAEEFVVADPAGWTVNAVEVLAYRPGPSPPLTSPFDGLYVGIYDGDPSAGGVLVAGGPDPATNLLATAVIAGNAPRLLANEWSGIYRTDDAAPAATDRPVMRVQAALPGPVTLAAGTYWLTWSLTGAGPGPSPEVPPLTVRGRGETGNALMFDGPFWSTIVDNGYSQGLPFRLFGSRPSDLGSIATASPGCGAATLRVEGAPVLGGFLHAAVENRTPGTLAWIGVDFTGFGAPMLLCGCQVGHPWSIAGPGETFGTVVPAAAALNGADVFIQGLEFGVPGCVFAPIELTETVRVTLH